MKPDKRWSRRAFVQGVGYTSALGATNILAPWKAAFAADAAQPQRAAMQASGFAYVSSSGRASGSAEPDFAEGGIHVFDVRGNRWAWKQSLASRSPAFLALHPNQQFLYAVNEIDEHQGLPYGTVEAYRINPHDGKLAFINRQSLSLSAIRPRHLAISPDGRHLVVAVHGGGAYNVLPIESNGAVGCVTGILKEAGSGPHHEYQTSAHPHTVVFDKTGRYFLATDEGCDRLTVFSLQGARMVRRHRVLLQPGVGPGHIAIHPSGSLLYVSNASDGSIACYRLREGTRKIEREICSVKASSARSDRTWNQNSLVIPPSGGFLYASFAAGMAGGQGDGIAAWKIDPATGELSQIQTWSEGKRSLRTLISTPDGLGLLAIDSGQGSVFSIGIDTGSGKLGVAVTLAEIAGPASLVMKYL